MKRDVAFLEQRGRHLEDACLGLARRLGECGGPPPPIIGSGICGDDYITDLSSHFSWRLVHAYEIGRLASTKRKKAKPCR